MRYQAQSTATEVRAIVAHGRLLLARAVRAAWQARLLNRDPDGLFSSVLGSKDVEALLTAVDLPVADVPATASTRERLAAPRLVQLLGSIGCGPVANDILATALSIELDATARSLASYLRGVGSGAALSFGSLNLALGPDSTGELLLALGAGAPLRRHRMLEVSEKAGEVMATATLRAAPRLLRWLVEPNAVDDEVADFGSLWIPDGGPELAPAAMAALEDAIEHVRAFIESQRSGGRGRADLVLRGPRGTGRGEIVREACRRLGVPLLAAPVAALFGQPNPAEAAAALLREALLLDAQLLLEGAESLQGADEGSARLRIALAASARPLLLTSSGADQPRLGPSRPLITRDVAIAATHDREEIWRELLPEVPAGEIASLYRVGVGAIGRCADGARLRAQVRGAERVGSPDVAAAVRAEFETDLGSVATKVDVSQSWEDLVVPDETGRTIAELVDQLRHRSTVLGRWGFQRKLGKGLGTTALFSGEPGTGKSMVAGLIAKELGLELYQIDLSRVLSKWIGETEKNLSKVFDAAETGHVVLLFDEADALLGKRTTDVKSANDRYANIETNYILQRLEAFHGVAILTSNLESSIDPALSRRLSFELRFPFPDEEQRAEIWRRMMPAELPLAGDIDYPMLAARFELAGGHIRNIVLRAAYLAAGDGTDGLAQAHLMRAAEYEYRDHGMLIARGRLSK
jgi:ATPase family protein associated with various cellular activities (AAA)/winged helix domain-containing protein